MVFFELSDFGDTGTRLRGIDLGGEVTVLTAALFFTSQSGTGTLFWRGVLGVLSDLAASTGRVGVTRFFLDPDLGVDCRSSNTALGLDFVGVILVPGRLELGELADVMELDLDRDWKLSCCTLRVTSVAAGSGGERKTDEGRERSMVR